MSSQKTRKGQKKTYTEEDLQNALKDRELKKTSVRKICAQYGIPKSTLLDKISGRRPLGVNKPGPEPTLKIEGERKIAEWLVNMSKCGFPLKKQELLDTVQNILKDGNIKNNFKDDRPGQSWYELLMARHKELSLKNAEGINRARSVVTEESIRAWFKELEQYLESINQKQILNDPKRIFNGDEAGFALCPKTGKVLGARGYKNMYQIKSSNEKDSITILVTFNASGDICPPCVVFPYIRPPKAVVDSMPQEWCLGRSESGWMRGDVFFEFVTKTFNNWVVRNAIEKPVLLLVDGHKSHMSLALSTFCEQMQIILYALPPNTTHILQPADVSVFAPLKSYWKNTVRDFLSKPENVNIAVTKTNFSSLLKDALQHPNMPRNIINGFNRCGLYPFDPNSPDYTKCVRNTLENLNFVEEQISHANIKNFKKILKQLRPTLKAQKVNTRAITKAVNELKKTLPAEVGVAEISLITESENSQEEISVNEEAATANDIETNLAPCTSKLMLSPLNIGTLNENNFSVSTLHLSGSIVDIGSIVSLDDLLFLPPAEETTKEPMPDPPLTPTISHALISTENITPTSSRPVDPFKRHLMLPELKQKNGKNRQKIPAAIASKKWREFYENKEREKQEKESAIRKRKLERVKRKEEKQKVKDTQSAAKRKKRNREAQKENSSPKKNKCAECDDLLISDVEDEGEKNIGCDTCMRWYHMKCTQFAGLPYLGVQDISFFCNFCK